MEQFSNSIVDIHYQQTGAATAVNPLGATAFKWYAAKNNIERQVSMFPESFPLEPLLRHKQRIYRRAVLMKNFKIVYVYYPSSDTVRIVDIWDTRMNPETLKQRL